MDPPTDDATTLTRANQEFYDAFEALSLERMEHLWAHDETVYCVHPGSDLVDGWPAVRRSWAAIFAGTDYLQFIVTDVTPRSAGDTGIVTCTENILSTAEHADHLGSAKAVATNVFARSEEGWRMVAHHASPVVGHDQVERE